MFGGSGQWQAGRLESSRRRTRKMQLSALPEAHDAAVRPSVVPLHVREVGFQRPISPRKVGVHSQRIGHEHAVVHDRALCHVHAHEMNEARAIVARARGQRSVVVSRWRHAKLLAQQVARQEEASAIACDVSCPARRRLEGKLRIERLDHRTCQQRAQRARHAAMVLLDTQRWCWDRSGSTPALAPASAPEVSTGESVDIWRAGDAQRALRATSFARSVASFSGKSAWRRRFFS